MEGIFVFSSGDVVIRFRGVARPFDIEFSLQRENAYRVSVSERFSWRQLGVGKFLSLEGVSEGRKQHFYVDGNTVVDDVELICDYINDSGGGLGNGETTESSKNTFQSYNSDSTKITGDSATRTALVHEHLDSEFQA
jgi:hypothetical protein